jgi:pheromone shutdown protein TraB
MIKFILCLSRYMSYTLLKVASESRTVVAVVGRGHLEGIKNNWKKPVKVGEHYVIFLCYIIIINSKIYS